MTGQQVTYTVAQGAKGPQATGVRASDSVPSSVPVTHLRCEHRRRTTTSDNLSQHQHRRPMTSIDTRGPPPTVAATSRKLSRTIKQTRPAPASPR